jgi:putative transposase
VFFDHYNAHRPHRSLDLAPPNGRPALAKQTDPRTVLVKQRDRLGGLIHEYERAA